MALWHFDTSAFQHFSITALAFLEFWGFQTFRHKIFTFQHFGYLSLQHFCFYAFQGFWGFLKSQTVDLDIGTIQYSIPTVKVVQRQSKSCKEGQNRAQTVKIKQRQLKSCKNSQNHAETDKIMLRQSKSCKDGQNHA